VNTKERFLSVSSVTSVTKNHSSEFGFTNHYMYLRIIGLTWCVHFVSGEVYVSCILFFLFHLTLPNGGKNLHTRDAPDPEFSDLARSRDVGSAGSRSNKIDYKASANNWELMAKLLSLLKPFFELTKQLNSKEASISRVIPDVQMLDALLAKENNTQRVQTTKHEWHEALINSKHLWGEMCKATANNMRKTSVSLS